MTRANERTHEPPWRASATRPRGVERALDAVRAASMADEGGCAGAAMELREQLAEAHPRAHARRARAALQRHAWWGAAGAVAGLIAGVLLGRYRTAPQ